MREGGMQWCLFVVKNVVQLKKLQSKGPNECVEERERTEMSSRYGPHMVDNID